MCVWITVGCEQFIGNYAVEGIQSNESLEVRRGVQSKPQSTSLLYRKRHQVRNSDLVKHQYKEFGFAWTGSSIKFDTAAFDQREPYGN